MNLRRKTLLIVGAVLLISMVGLYSISRIFLLSKFEEIEVTRIQDQVEMTQLLLEREASQIDFMAVTLGQLLQSSTQLSSDIKRLLASEHSNIDLVAIANSHVEGGILIEYLSNQAQQVSATKAVLQQSLGQFSDKTHGVMAVEGILLLVGRYNIPTEAVDTGGRQLLLARIVGEAELKDIGRINGSTIRLDVTVSDETDTRTKVFWPASERIGSRLSFEDVFGQQTLNLIVEAEPAILIAGRHSVKLFFVTAAVAAVGLFIISLVLHDRLLLRRLLFLIKEVKAISRNSLDGQRVSVNGNDELSILAKAINQGIEQLENTHQELRENEQQLNELIEAIPDLVCFKDADGRWRRVNRNGLRILGLDSIDVLGKRNEEIATKSNLIADALRLDTEKGLQVKSSRIAAKYEAVFNTDHGSYCLNMIKIPLSDEQTGVHKGMVVLGRDITDQKLYQDASLFERVFASSSDGIMITNADKLILLVNDAFTHITGYSLDESLGCTPALLQSGKHDKAFYEEMWRAINKDDHWSGEVWNRRRDGELYPQQLTLDVVRDANGALINYVAILKDVSEQKEAEEVIAKQANYDSLTGLPNRNLFQELLSRAIREAQRHETLLAVVFIDLDRFKSINDSLGHDAGDLLLKAVAQRLQGCLRQTDTVARLSGDEFVVLLTNLVAAEHVLKVCELMLESLNKSFDLAGHEAQISASIGGSLYPSDADSSEKLLKHADTAMYASKEGGRGQFCFFSREMEIKAAAATEITWALRSALKFDQLSLHYQPIIDLNSGALHGVEALLRWQHPKLGAVSPAVFIPLAEERGLIGELGEWVLWQAARDIVSLRDYFPSSAYVAVNVSSRQWRLHDMHALVSCVCEKTGLSTKQLVLEITEQSVISDIEFVSQQLRELKLMGVRALLDDFGTGYSSLSHLKSLPVSGLKVDRAFINDVTEQEEDAVLVRATLAIARSMRLCVVAEGVETLEQHDWLKNEGVHHVQGYLYARPMPLEELRKLIKSTDGGQALAPADAFMKQTESVTV